MSQRLFLVVVASAAVWSATGLLCGVRGLGLGVLWVSSTLSLMLALLAWRTFTAALAARESWAPAMLAALGITAVVGVGLFVSVKQVTHHRPLGAATLAVTLVLVWGALLAAGVRLRVGPKSGLGLTAVALAVGLVLAAPSFGGLVWLQLAVGSAALVACVFVQRGEAEVGTAPWFKWALGAVLLGNLAFLVLGLPPTVQEAPIVLSLLGVLS